MTERLFLKSGAHSTLADGACAMEAVAWMAGEPHSDRPQCVSLLIAAYCRGINDRLPDDLRQRMIPVLLDTIGTRTIEADDQTRLWLMLDWTIRTALPWWLRNARADDWAMKVEGLTSITSRETASAAREVALEAKKAMYSDAADADAAAAARRKFWEANLDGCLDLIRRMCAVGRKDIDTIAERVELVCGTSLRSV